MEKVKPSNLIFWRFEGIPLGLYNLDTDEGYASCKQSSDISTTSNANLV